MAQKPDPKSFQVLRITTLISHGRGEVDVEIALDDGDGGGGLRLQHAHLVRLGVVHDGDHVAGRETGEISESVKAKR